MRLTPDEARKYGAFRCWHAEHCCEVEHVTWADSESAQYEQIPYPFVIMGDSVLRVTHQARKIIIDYDRLLVIINPVENKGGVCSAERITEIGA